MSAYGWMLLLCLLPPTEAPIVADPIANQVLRDTVYLLDLWPRDGSAWGEFSAELRWTQRHQRETYGAPLLADSGRLPSSRTIDAYLEFNGRYGAFLEAQWGIWEWSRLEQTLAENARCREWWSLAQSARNAQLQPVYRRLALRQIKEMLGEADYYGSRWPCWVPVNRFMRGW